MQNMTKCSHQQAVCVNSTGGTKTGQFQEEYECPCGAKGTVTGNAEDPPREWTRYGEVFA